MRMKLLVLLIAGAAALSTQVALAEPLLTILAENNRDLDRPEAIVTSATVGSPGTPQTSFELKDRAFNSTNRHHEYTAVRTDPATGLLSINPAHNLQPFPSYLVGAEYIQIANENRDNQNYSLDIRVHQPGVFAYLFIDNRLNGPEGNTSSSNTTDPVLGGRLQWVIDDGWERVNTGFMPNGQADYIGLDELGMIAGSSAAETCPLRSNPENGSGVGLNQFFAIYTKTFAPGDYTGFVKQQWIGGSNMYGVAVQPIPEPGSLMLLAMAGLGLLLWRRARQ